MEGTVKFVLAPTVREAHFWLREQGLNPAAHTVLTGRPDDVRHLHGTHQPRAVVLGGHYQDQAGLTEVVSALEIRCADIEYR